MDIQNLFPTAIGLKYLEKGFQKKELAFVNAQERRANMGNSSSVDTHVLNAPDMKRLRKLIEENLQEYFNQIFCPPPGMTIHLTQSWLNYTTKGQWHHKHNHSNSIVSGVLYVNANADCDKITFHKSEVPPQIWVQPQEWNPWNSQTWWFAVGTGMLIMFPSVLMHDVGAVEHDDTRISLSFNSFVKGNLGAMESLTHLAIK